MNESIWLNNIFINHFYIIIRYKSKYHLLFKKFLHNNYVFEIFELVFKMMVLYFVYYILAHFSMYGFRNVINEMKSYLFILSF